MQFVLVTSDSVQTEPRTKYYTVQNIDIETYKNNGNMHMLENSKKHKQP